MEVSALKHTGVVRHGRSPLLRLQSDERLISLIRKGNHHAFESLVDRYQARLLSFCRHMLASKEDAEDVLQEVFAAAFNAILADERDINVRPWLYRIARNRSLNHLRRVQPIGVDSMDVHLSESGTTTADKVHKREEFRQLISDVQTLPETQRTALLLRELDALSYDQIAEAMETTVPSVKSLLVRARVSLAEASEARSISCDEVRLELGEVAEGLTKISPPVRRHLKMCERCHGFRDQLKETNKALAMVFPVGPLLLAKKLFLAHVGTTSAAGGSGAAAGAGGAAAGTAAGGAAGGLLSAGVSTVASKAAAGLAAAAIVTVGAVEIDHVTKKQGAGGNVVEQVAAAPAPPVPAAPPQVQPASTPDPVPASAPPVAARDEKAGSGPEDDAKAKDLEKAPAEQPAAALAVPVTDPAAETAPAATTTPTETTPSTTTPATTPAPGATEPPKTQIDGDTTTLPPDATTPQPSWGDQPPAPSTEPAPAPEPEATPTPEPSPEPAPAPAPAPSS